MSRPNSQPYPVGRVAKQAGKRWDLLRPLFAPLTSIVAGIAIGIGIENIGHPDDFPWFALCVAVTVAAIVAWCFWRYERYLRRMPSKNGSFLYVSTLIANDRDLPRWTNAMKDAPFDVLEPVRRSIDRADGEVDGLTEDLRFALKSDRSDTPTNIVTNGLWHVMFTFGATACGYLDGAIVWYLREPPSPQSDGAKPDDLGEKSYFRSLLVDVLRLDESLFVGPSTPVEHQPRTNPVCALTFTRDIDLTKFEYESSAVLPPGAWCPTKSASPRVFSEWSRAAATAILRLAKSDHEEIFLAAALPKPVALAAGYIVGKALNPRGDEPQKLNELLSRLTFLEFSPESQKVERVPKRTGQQRRPNLARFENWTPHDVVIVDSSGSETHRFVPSGNVARVGDTDGPQQSISIEATGSAVPTTSVRRTGVDHMPRPVDGTGYIVSRVAAAAFPERGDLYFPFEEVRDVKGMVIACRHLANLEADRTR